MKNPTKSVLVLAVLAAAGCASVPETDPVMVDARVSVNAARSNPTAPMRNRLLAGQEQVGFDSPEQIGARGTGCLPQIEAKKVSVRQA